MDVPSSAVPLPPNAWARPSSSPHSLPHPDLVPSSTTDTPSHTVRLSSPAQFCEWKLRLDVVISLCLRISATLRLFESRSSRHTGETEQSSSFRRSSPLPPHHPAWHINSEPSLALPTRSRPDLTSVLYLFWRPPVFCCCGVRLRGIIAFLQNELSNLRERPSAACSSGGRDG